MACAQAYCTRDDIRARLPALKVEGGNPRLDNQVDVGIREAQTEIDAVLGSLHKVPFSQPIPALVRSIAGYLAAAFVLDGGFSAGAEPTKLADRYRELAHQRLTAIVEGELQLFPSDDPAADQDEDQPGFYAHHTGVLPVLDSFNPYAV